MGPTLDHVPRLLDTLSGFESFARKAALQTPMERERLWTDMYESAYPEVFEAFYAEHGSPEGRPALVRELSRVRTRVDEAAPVVREAVANTESKLGDILGTTPDPTPRHVLMVGTLTANAVVGRLADEVAVFHCLEWYQTESGAKALVAHETTHAWHELILGQPLPTDAAGTAFAEGVAIAASRQVMADLDPSDYFWYGHPETDTWLDWCREHHDVLVGHFADALDEETTPETYFGGGTIDGQWRVGFYLADWIVTQIDRPLPELVRMSVGDADAAVRQVLGVSSR